MTLDEIKAAVLIIKQATGADENTATRLGAVLENLVNYIAVLELTGGGGGTGGVVPFPVTSLSDLNRIDLPNGSYNIEGADVGFTGILFVGNYKIATVLDSVIQIYINGGTQLLYRIIPIAEPLVYPAWTNLTMSEAERATLEANTAFIDSLKSTKTTATTDTIEPDFSFVIWRTSNTGTAAIAITTFTNWPTYTCERELVVLNSRGTALVLTPRTANLTVGAVTYTFINMGTATITIPAGKSAELSYKIIKISDTSYEIRLAFAIQP